MTNKWSWKWQNALIEWTSVYTLQVYFVYCNVHQTNIYNHNTGIETGFGIHIWSMIVRSYGQFFDSAAKGNHAWLSKWIIQSTASWNVRWRVILLMIFKIPIEHRTSCIYSLKKQWRNIVVYINTQINWGCKQCVNQKQIYKNSMISHHIRQ